MTLTFHSINDQDEKVLFRAPYEVIDGKIIFDDKSTTNTRIEIIPGCPLKFKRTGNINMDITFALGEKTKAHYQAKEVGFDFDFEVFTEKLEFENNKFSIEYTMFLYGDRFSSHKIWILLH